MALERIIDNKIGLNGSEIWYDSDEDRMVINHSRDVEPTLDANKRKFNASDKSFKEEVFNEVANIPFEIVLQWKKEGLDIFDESPETQKKLLKKLNDPEWRHLRTKPGRL